MRETKYMKALKNGKNYMPMKSRASDIKEYVVMGLDTKANKTYTTVARVQNNRQAKKEAIGWCKKHGLKFERVTLV